VTTAARNVSVAATTAASWTSSFVAYAAWMLLLLTPRPWASCDSVIPARPSTNARAAACGATAWRVRSPRWRRPSTRLDLDNVTLVGNDTGGAIVQLLMGDGAARLGRVVLASCDAFDNFRPGLTGKTLVLTGKLMPAMFGLFMQQMRLRPLRRLPIAFGWLTKRGDSTTRGWIKPVLASALSAATRSELCARSPWSQTSCWTPRSGCRPFDHPALVVWASEDRVMPPEHGHRLPGILPPGRLVEVADSYPLIPLDQPTTLAQSIRDSPASRRAAGRTRVEMAPLPGRGQPGRGQPGRGGALAGIALLCGQLRRPAGKDDGWAVTACRQ
jgi:alpha/beta hydrolase fold